MLTSAIDEDLTGLHQCSAAAGRKPVLLLALAQARVIKAIMTFNIW